MVNGNHGYILRLVVEAVVGNLKTSVHILVASEEVVAKVFARCLNGDDTLVVGLTR